MTFSKIVASISVALSGNALRIMDTQKDLSDLKAKLEKFSAEGDNLKYSELLEDIITQAKVSKGETLIMNDDFSVKMSDAKQLLQELDAEKQQYIQQQIKDGNRSGKTVFASFKEKFSDVGVDERSFKYMWKNMKKETMKKDQEDDGKLATKAICGGAGAMMVGGMLYAINQPNESNERWVFDSKVEDGVEYHWKVDRATGIHYRVDPDSEWEKNLTVVAIILIIVGLLMFLFGCRVCCYGFYSNQQFDDEDGQTVGEPN